MRSPGRRPIVVVLAALVAAGCATGPDDTATAPPPSATASQPDAAPDARPDGDLAAPDTSPEAEPDVDAPPDDVDAPPDAVDTGEPAGTVAAVEQGDDFSWQPHDLQVQTGETVVWVNDGERPHTVTGSGLNSGPMEPDERYEVTFDEAGTFVYSCYLHQGMGGEITVR